MNGATRRTSRARSLVVALVVATSIGTTFAARAGAGPDERRACLAAAAAAPKLREDGKFRAARARLLACASSTCPSGIQRECLDALAQLDAIAPTVVFSARAGGRDLIDVRVSVAGQILTDRLDGKPLGVDAGTQTFRLEHEGVVREETVTVVSGQKSRSVFVTFELPAQPTPVASAPADPPERSAEETSRGSIAPALVVGSLGVVALGSFAYFGLRGRAQLTELEQCKPRCPESDVEAARTNLLAADVSLVGGVAALGLATFLFFSHGKASADTRPGKSGGLRIRPSTAGGAGVSGTF